MRISLFLALWSWLFLVGMVVASFAEAAGHGERGTLF